MKFDIFLWRQNILPARLHSEGIPPVGSTPAVSHHCSVGFDFLHHSCPWLDGLGLVLEAQVESVCPWKVQTVLVFRGQKDKLCTWALSSSWMIDFHSNDKSIFKYVINVKGQIQAKLLRVTWKQTDLVNVIWTELRETRRRLDDSACQGIMLHNHIKVRAWNIGIAYWHLLSASAATPVWCEPEAWLGLSKKRERCLHVKAHSGKDNACKWLFFSVRRFVLNAALVCLTHGGLKRSSCRAGNTSKATGALLHTESKWGTGFVLIVPIYRKISTLYDCCWLAAFICTVTALQLNPCLSNKKWRKKKHFHKSSHDAFQLGGGSKKGISCATCLN